MKAKKSLGQHFLIQPAIAAKIADALTLEGYAHLLEIGPGTGMLTAELLRHQLPVTALELDQRLIDQLLERFAGQDLNLVCGHALRLPWHELLGPVPFALVGNFPYNISSQLVFRMLDFHPVIPEMVGMFQLEMARRIIASHGNKDYGILSVLAQVLYDGKLLFQVGRKNFNPPPKVESAVIRLRRKETMPDCDLTVLKRIVKAAFNQRRKMLRNSLAQLIAQDFLKSDARFKLRPEQLSVNDFIDLSKDVQNLIINH